MESNEFFQRVRLSGNPHAHPDSVVTCGQARFTVLTARLLRLEWSPTGVFTDDTTFAFPNRRAESQTRFDVVNDGEWLRIDTGALTLAYRLESGRFAPENLAITFRVGAAERVWRPGQIDTENLGGTRRTLDMTGGDVPLEPGLVSRAGWALFDDSAGVTLSDDGWVGARAPGSDVDWYFFGYGHAYGDAIAEYAWFGGAAPLIPRYVLGVWWSRFWPYSATDLERLVDDFAAHTLPLDVLVVDMDWHLPGRWTGYSWNHDLFPDPESFLADMHARGLHVTLNLHPADGVHPHESAYDAFARALGVPENERAAIPFHITDRQFARLYFTLLHHPLEEQGVDFWWLDWQQGESSEIAGLDPLLWLNHLHFSDARRRGQRPMLFSRWGGLGNHRYPIGFSGDTFGGWQTLASLPHFTATAANVGFGWWSHDIGGHFGAVDDELFTRWTQFGALSPCLRLHAVKDPLAERRPWAFSARALDAIRGAFDLRYTLVPYLYTMARKTHDTGAALCRPMYYEYPEQESAYLARDQYFLGDDLIAAPVTTPVDAATGLATKVVWIPPGAWYRFDTGEAFTGPRWVRISADLETIPLFARAGAIVPTMRTGPHLAEVPNDWLDVRVYPGGEGTFRLYEDDGATEDYLREECEWTTFSNTHDGSAGPTLRIDPVVGRCAALPASRGYCVTYIGVEPPEQMPEVDGEPGTSSYDRAARTLRVTIPARSKSESTTVVVQWPADRGEAQPTPAASTEPFTHVIAYSAPDEARRQLADALLIPPPPGAPGEPLVTCDVELWWRSTSAAGDTVIRSAIRDLTAETISTAPFAFDDDLQPRRLELTTTYDVGERRLTSTYRGPCVNPPIQRWSVRYHEQASWQVCEPESASRLNVTEPFTVQLSAQATMTAQARAIVDIPVAATLLIDTWTTGSLTLRVDGAPPEAGWRQTTLVGLARPWPIERLGPITLAAGRHAIDVHLKRPEMGPWIFGALLMDETGEPLVRCAYAPDDERLM